MHKAEPIETPEQDYEAWRRNDETLYGGYTVKSSPDFGTAGTLEDHAWVITRDGINPMPDATFARSREEAFAMVNIYEAVGRSDTKFWNLLRALQYFSQNRPPQGPAQPGNTAGRPQGTGKFSAAVREGPLVWSYFVISYGNDERSMEKTERLTDFAAAREIFVGKICNFNRLVVMSGHWNDGEIELGHWDIRPVK